MSWKKEANDISKRRRQAADQGGADAVERHHDKGRLTIRERIDQLADDQSFREFGAGAGHSNYDETGALTSFSPANFVLGLAKIDGRRVAVGGEDFTLGGGSPNEAGLRKSIYAEQLALDTQVPLIRLHEGAGGSVAGPSGKGRSTGDPVYAVPRFSSIVELLGKVPVVTAALGPVAGLPAARLAASHFSVMSKRAQVLVAGPAVVERALGKKLTKEDLGGVDVHSKSGVVDNVAEDEQDAFAQIRRALSYLPSHVWECPPHVIPTDPPDRPLDELLDVVPKDRRKPFDMRRIIALCVDEGSFFEMTRGFGPGQITGLARVNGYPVGVLTNDCYIYAGAMTAEGAQKVRRFVDMCNTFHLPIVSFVDEPGFMIGPDAEKTATIRHGVAAIASVVQSRVPWVSIVVKKVFGVAGAAHFGPRGLVLAWPSAEMGALPVEGGVAVAFGREIAQADDPDALRRELEDKLADSQSPGPRAENFSVHELIDPRETRARLCDWIEWVWPTLERQLTPYSVTMRP